MPGVRDQSDFGPVGILKRVRADLECLTAQFTEVVDNRAVSIEVGLCQKRAKSEQNQAASPEKASRCQIGGRPDANGISQAAYGKLKTTIRPRPKIKPQAGLSRH